MSVQTTIEQPVVNHSQPAGIELPALYRSSRYGIDKDILVTEIDTRRGIVYYKDKETDKHTNTMSQAKFNKLFKPL